MMTVFLAQLLALLRLLNILVLATVGAFEIQLKTDTEQQSKSKGSSLYSAVILLFVSTVWHKGKWSIALKIILESATDREENISIYIYLLLPASWQVQSKSRNACLSVFVWFCLVSLSKTIFDTVFWSEIIFLKLKKLINNISSFFLLLFVTRGEGALHIKKVFFGVLLLLYSHSDIFSVSCMRDFVRLNDKHNNFTFSPTLCSSRHC